MLIVTVTDDCTYRQFLCLSFWADMPRTQSSSSHIKANLRGIVWGGMDSGQLWMAFRQQ